MSNVIDIRNLGLMAPWSWRRATLTTRAYVYLRCYEKGLLVRQTGDIIAMSPPLIATEGQIDEIMSILGDAISETGRPFVALGTAKEDFRQPGRSRGIKRGQRKRQELRNHERGDALVHVDISDFSRRDAAQKPSPSFRRPAI